MENSDLLTRIDAAISALEELSPSPNSMLRAARQRIQSTLKKKDDPAYSLLVCEIVETVAGTKEKHSISDISLFSLKVSGGFDDVVFFTHKYLNLVGTIPDEISNTGVYHQGFVKYHAMRPNEETGIFTTMKDHVYASNVIRREGMSQVTYYSEHSTFPRLVERHHEHVDELLIYIKDRDIHVTDLEFDHEAFKLYLATDAKSLRQGWL